MNKNDYIFEEIDRLIFKWIKKSKIAINKLIDYIFQLFVKLYFVEISFKLKIQYNITKIINPNIIFETNINLSNIPFFQDLLNLKNGVKKNEENKSISVLEYINIIKENEDFLSHKLSLINFIPNFVKDYEEEKMALMFLGRIIDSFFKEFTRSLEINIKSYLIKPLSLKYLKYFEFELFIREVISAINKTLSINLKSTDTVNYTNADKLKLFEIIFHSLLENGGILTKFYLYYYELIEKKIIENPNFEISIQKSLIKLPFLTPIWLNYLIFIRIFQNLFEKDDNLYKIFSDYNEDIEKLIFKPISILNPFCGIGMFLNSLEDLDFLKKSIEFSLYSIIKSKKYSDSNEKFFIDRKNIMIFSQYIMENTFGIDANPLYIDILRLNNKLSLITQNFGYPISNLICNDIFQNPHNKKYDFLFALFPINYQADKKGMEKIKKLEDNIWKNFDLIDLFILNSVKYLNNNGIGYIILPDSILYDIKYMKIRKYILENSEIVEIFYFKQNTFKIFNMSFIVLGLRKKEKHSIDLNSKINIFIQEIDFIENKYDVNKIIDAINYSLSKIDEKFDKDNSTQPILFKSYSLKQKDFLENQNYEFEILITSIDKEFLLKIEKSSSILLRKLVNLDIGMNLNKKGSVINCYQCNTWLSSVKWGIDKNSGEKYFKCSKCKRKIYLRKIKKRDELIIEIPFRDKDKINELFPNIKYHLVITEQNLEKFHIKNLLILKDGYKGINYLSSKVFDKNKIVINPKADEIIAIIDYNNSHIIQPLCQFSIKEETQSNPYILEFILGIITSNTINKYFNIKYIFKKKLKISDISNKISNILNIPIPKIDFKNISNYSFYGFIAISFYIMLIILLMQVNYLKDLNAPIINRIKKFLKRYKKYLETQGIIEMLIKILEMDPLDLIQNPNKIKDPIQKTEILLNEIDLIVKRLYNLEQIENNDSQEID